MTPAKKKESLAYFFEFQAGQLCVVDASGDPIMKVRPEEVEMLVQTLGAEELSLSRLNDALVEGIKSGFNVIDWNVHEPALIPAPEVETDAGEV